MNTFPVSSKTWDDFWDGITPLQEITKWDFYGGRSIILTHTPRFGRILEAGCGMGRYYLYLRKLGIQTIGVDFNSKSQMALGKWLANHDIQNNLAVSQIESLPFKNNEISAYLSFGVLEHFKLGPSKALAEAYRVLRPGGVAVISTPAPSFSYAILRILRYVKDRFRRLVGQRIPKRPFFQYYYSVSKLTHFLVDAGFSVKLAHRTDLRYALWELNLHRIFNGILLKFAETLDRTWVASLGSQSIVVAIKEDPDMYCFLCGKRNVKPKQLSKFYMPICLECESLDVSTFYQKSSRCLCSHPTIYNSLPETTEQLKCDICGDLYKVDSIFGKIGFNSNICNDCIKDPITNIQMCQKDIQPIWIEPKRKSHPDS